MIEKSKMFISDYHTLAIAKSQKNSMDRKYLTINEAAKIVGVTPLTLRNWDKKGLLTAYRNPLNNYRVYRLDQIEVLLRKIENSKEGQRTRKIDVYSI